MSWSSLVGTAALGAHVVILLALVAVPGYAIFDAVRALGSAAELAGLIDGRRWLALLGNTAIVCALAAVTATVLGAALGLLAARTDMPGRRLLAGAAVLGACVPVYVSAIFVFAVIPVWRYAGSAAVCGLLYGLFATPLATVILAAAFRAADRDLEDSARLNAGQWAMLWRVTIPQAAWGLTLVATLVVLTVATDFTIADLLLVRTFAEEVYTQFALHQSAAGPVLAWVPVLVVVAALLGLIQARFRLLGEHSPWQFGVRPRTIALGRWRWLAALGCLGFVAAVVGTPAVALLRRIESLAHCVKLAGDLGHELLVSAFGSLAGATLVVALAVGLAWGVLRTRRLRWVIAAGVVVLLATPAPVVGISLIQLLNRPGWLGLFYDCPAVIVVGYLVRFLPLGVLLLVPAVRRIPADQEAAARVDGCAWPGVQRYVYWPAVARDALVVWLVIVILCFGEVSCTMLLAPPGWPPAAVRAFTLLHFGVYQDLAVLSLVAVGCILVPWVALVLLLRQRVGWGER
jgi:iron(III) transport system permease protein